MMRTVYRWKCQKCGHDWARISKDEPIQCPVCLDKGAKSFEGKENSFEGYIKSLSDIEKITGYTIKNNSEWVDKWPNAEWHDIRIFAKEDHTFCPFSFDFIDRYFGTGVKIKLGEIEGSRIYTIFIDDDINWKSVIWKDCINLTYPKISDFISEDEMEIK